MTRPVGLLCSAVVCASVLVVALCLDSAPGRDSPRTERANLSHFIPDLPQAGLETAAETPDKPSAEETAAVRPEGGLYPLVIRQPEGPPRVKLAGADPLGREAEVACSTCHSVRKPNLVDRREQPLKEFHQGLQVSHGKLGCYACHNVENADALRLADGKQVEYSNVMQLCSQCHSAQATSFAHGAHGGMNGHWDRTRGVQTKNNCIDCHDPHAPTYPKMIVDFKPRDRFLPGGDQHE